MSALLDRGLSLHRRTRVDSTNDEVRRLAGSDPAGTLLLVADEQTAGRGRLGRRWHSPHGTGLYLSWLRRPGPDAAELTRWTLAAGVAVHRALERHGIRGVRLEWPNDLVLRGRKLGGLLAESRSQGGRVSEIVVGVGINLMPPGGAPPEDVRERAISLAESTAGDGVPDRIALARSIADELDRAVAGLDGGGWDALAAAWLARSLDAPGRRVETLEDGRPGVTAGLDAHGALLVRRDDGSVDAVRLADGVRPLEP